MADTSGMAIASFVLGLCTFFFSWFLPVIGILLPILSIIFGALGIKDIKRNGKAGFWMAIVGIVLGVFGILAQMFIIIGLVAFFSILSPSAMLPA